MSAYKVACWIPVSREVFGDFDRVHRPWAYPDPPLDLHVDPFPGITRLGQRIIDAIYGARYAIAEWVHP